MLTWPVLKSYSGQKLARVAMPVGGIGTGTVSLGGRGDLIDWELMNRPAKGFIPVEWEVSPFFALFARAQGGEAVGRLLEGPLRFEEYEGSSGCVTPQHGYPRFRSAEFHAAYPLAQIVLEDDAVPLRVALQVFNPLIPCNEADSSLPVVVYRVLLCNEGSVPVDAAVAGTLPNFIGMDGSEVAAKLPNGAQPYAGPKDNRNTYRSGDAVQGLYMTSDGVPGDHPAWGSMALTCPASASDVTYRSRWTFRPWRYTKRHFWEEFLADGRLIDGEGGETDMPLASLAQRQTIAPGETAALEFYLTWHFPNRRTWTPLPEPSPEDIIGNAYCARFPDAWAAAEAIAPRLPALEAETVHFVQALVDSPLPHEVKEAALFNVSTLRTQTCFQTPDGYFYYWEGCHDRVGSCHGNCTHVWNYENTSAFLFGRLAQRSRETEFLYATNDRGHMAFRLALPLGRQPHREVAAADGQMGCLMRLYREWQLSGDDAWLAKLWPQAQKALEFSWIPNGWDADQDGVMEGCQHNTMDVEYYGPNPQMGFWYLGALAACERMSRHLGDDAFAERCASLRARGSEWMEQHLFNGEYYIHEVRPPGSADRIAEGLRTHMGTEDFENPDLQLANGCLVDQLVGQYTAHVLGLGPLGNVDHTRTTLKSILKYNRRSGFQDHFNHLRSYVLGDETALLMASYPHGRPERPFPYFSEVMTGFEYVAAIHLMYEGMMEEGLQCIRDIRERYDGERRNPFDEAECGHHYGRAMAAWAALLACTGFQYSAVERTMSFAIEKSGSYFWSNGFAWGIIRVSESEAELKVHRGTLLLKRLSVNGFEVDAPESSPSLTEGAGLLCPFK